MTAGAAEERLHGHTRAAADICQGGARASVHERYGRWDCRSRLNPPVTWFMAWFAAESDPEYQRGSEQQVSPTDGGHVSVLAPVSPFDPPRPCGVLARSTMAVNPRGYQQKSTGTLPPPLAGKEVGMLRRRWRVMLLVVLLVVVLPPTCFAVALHRWFPDSSGPGPAWTGRSRNGYGWTEAQAAAFTDFSLFWLGRQFAGYNLQMIDGAHGTVFFLYGRCTAGGNLFISEGGCAPPLQVYTRRRGTVDVVRAPLASVRGEALAARPTFASEVTIWTGSVVVTISGQRELLEPALESLRGFGSAATIGPGEPLPAPSTAPRFSDPP